MSAFDGPFTWGEVKQRLKDLGAREAMDEHHMRGPDGRMHTNDAIVLERDGQAPRVVRHPYEQHETPSDDDPIPAYIVEHLCYELGISDYEFESVAAGKNGDSAEQK